MNDFGAKILIKNVILGWAWHHLNSYAYAQHVLKGSVQFENFTLILYWALEGTDEYAQQPKFLTRMLSAHIHVSTWCVCSVHAVPNAYLSACMSSLMCFLSTYMSSLCECSVHAWVAYMHASIHISSFCASWGYTKLTFEKWENWYVHWA